MSQATQLIMGLIMVCVVGLLIYLCVAGGYTLALKIHQGAGTKGGFWYKDRPDWVPESWLEWAGKPGTFNKLINSSAPTSTVYEIISGVTNVNTCKLKCDKKNSDQASPACKGFEYEPSTKKCYLVSSLDFVQAGSNVVYLYASSEYTPSAQIFNKSTSNTVPVTAETIEGGAYVETNKVPGCSANCLSNTSCTAFTFISSSNTCRRVSNVIATTTLTALAGTDTYILSSTSGVADTTQYWT